VELGLAEVNGAKQQVVHFAVLVESLERCHLAEDHQTLQERNPNLTALVRLAE